MVYYTIYMKGLFNATGFIDVGLEDDTLLKDYLSYLDIGMKSHKTYRIAGNATTQGQAGLFAVNLAEIAAITTTTGE